VKKFLPENLDKDAAREIASDEQKNNCREGNGVALPSRRAYPSGGNWMQEVLLGRQPESRFLGARQGGRRGMTSHKCAWLQA
jgi:hypothetical protein